METLYKRLELMYDKLLKKDMTKIEEIVKKIETVIECINDNAYIKPKNEYKLDYEVEETWVIELENVIQDLESVGNNSDLKNGKLPIPHVSQQSELLINFLKYCRAHGETWILKHEIEKLVKDFLKIN